jgi:hypothetical protein
MIALRVLGAGLLATLTMDVGGGLCRKLGLTAGVPPPAFAKWFGHLFRGTFSHADVMQAPDVPGGLPLALGCHYLIGLTLTGAFWFGLMKLTDSTLSVPVLAAVAIGYGLATNVFPWLLMFPSMGYGVFGKDAPAEWMVVRTSFINHLWFGIGLFWTALVLRPKG